MHARLVMRWWRGESDKRVASGPAAAPAQVHAEARNSIIGGGLRPSTPLCCESSRGCKKQLALAHQGGPSACACMRRSNVANVSLDTVSRQGLIPVEEQRSPSVQGAEPGHSRSLISRQYYNQSCEHADARVCVSVTVCECECIVCWCLCVSVCYYYG